MKESDMLAAHYSQSLKRKFGALFFVTSTEILSINILYRDNPNFVLKNHQFIQNNRYFPADLFELVTLSSSHIRNKLLDIKT